MKSKAQQYADALLNPPIKPKDFYLSFTKQFVTARVTSEGNAEISLNRVISPTEALALRDWLTDTFDVVTSLDLGEDETKFPPTKY